MFSMKAMVAVPATLAVLGAGCTKEVSFKQDVYPILRERCLSCHSPGGEGYAASSFSVETYETVMKGTKFGPVVVPRSSISSTVMILLQHKADPSINMPKSKTQPLLEHEKFLKDWKTPMLPADQIRLIGDWIDQGANNN